MNGGSSFFGREDTRARAADTSPLYSFFQRLPRQPGNRMGLVHQQGDWGDAIEAAIWIERPLERAERPLAAAERPFRFSE
ncbi:hypothetical protein [Alkalicoccus chagannorensis]|uniref:hypothetical protein n=1 Tax=Alkalicoccus chagannorensis TaxID=427072 RepID=UPI00042A8175|nr:hypothetical protein [Alkalicoccus chagannorensis]